MSANVIIIALGAPFLWSIVNHADKFLLSKYFKSGGVGGLMIFSTLFSVFLLPIIYFVDRDAIFVEGYGSLILICAGILNGIAILLYLLALSDDEASIVVPFMQLIPFFAFIFGYFLLGEVLTSLQLLGGLVIILGTLLLSIGFSERKKIKFKTKVSILMIGHSLLFALYETLFKFVSIKSGFWDGVFWEAIGLIFFGVFLYLIPRFRNEFLLVFKKNSKAIIGVNIISEIFTIAGNWFMAFATLLAPLALVTLISGYQPVFVFIIGIFITLFFPKISEERITKGALFHKGIAILIILFGTYFLY